MIINQNSVMAKWHLWSLKVLDRTFSRGSFNESRVEEIENTGRTTLCEFYRNIAIGTILYISTLFAYSFLIFSVFVNPFIQGYGSMYLYRILTVLLGFIIAVAITATVCALAAAAFNIGHKFKDISKSLQYNQEIEPTPVNMIILYMLSIKKKFCPTIMIEKD